MSDWIDTTNQQYGNGNQTIIDLTNEAQKKGVGYGFGYKNPSSGAVDCSGWACHAANQLGYPLQGSAAEIAQQAADQGVLKQDKPIYPGDLVFGAGASHAKDRFNGIGHMGVVVQNGDKLFVSESSTNGPTLTPIENFISRYQGRLYSAPLDAYSTQAKAQNKTDYMVNQLAQIQQQKSQPMAGNDFQSTAMNYFVSKGWSPAAAAGMVGNLLHESGGKPDVSHDGGKGYGLAGWNGDRLQGLYNQYGQNPDIMNQLAYADWELRNTEKKAGDALANAKNPAEAAQIASNLYFRPGKPMLNNRIANSLSAYKNHTMGQAGQMAADVSGKATPSQQGEWVDTTAPSMPQQTSSEWADTTGQEQVEKPSALQGLAQTAVPYTKTLLPILGMTLSGMAAAPAGGLAEIPALGFGAYAGNQAQDWLERYAGKKPPLKNMNEAMQEVGKNMYEGGKEGLTAWGVGKATEPIFNYLANKLAPRMYQFILKPSTTLSKTERDAILKTGLEGGYPINRSGIDKLKADMGDVMSEVNGLVNQATQSGKTVSLESAAQKLDNTIAKYSNSPIPSEYLDKIKTFRDRMLAERGTELTPAAANQMKRDLYQILPDNAWGEQFTTLTNDTRKDLARGIKEELEGIIPELKTLNAQWGEKKDFLDVLERAVGRIDNRYPLGFLDAIAGGTVGGITHDPAAGIVTAVASKLMMDPTVNSYVAMALRRMPMANYRKLLTNSLGYGTEKAVDSKLPKINFGEAPLEPVYQP